MSTPRFLSVGSAVAQARIEQPTTADSLEWLKALAVWPDSALPEETPLRQHVITFFNVTEHRAEGGQYFVAGRGYAEINGGGTFFSGMNRAQDPYLELTILPSGSSALEECRRLLVSATFETHAVAVTGVGYFAEMPGAQSRQLGVFRLDTLAGCKLVGRF